MRIFRQRLELSQEELAWRADMHRTYLADVERGRRNLSLSSIARLVGALDVTLGAFFVALEGPLQSPVATDPVAAPAGSAAETRKSQPRKLARSQRRSARARAA